MCLTGAQSHSLVSADGKLLINYCLHCIEVIETSHMQVIQSKEFKNITLLRVKENKKGDFDITANILRLKYVRKDNQFVEIKTGVLVANNRKPKIDETCNLLIYKDLSLFHTIDNTIPGFIMYGKRNLYYLKKEHNTWMFRIHKLTFNIKKNSFVTTKSDFSFVMPGSISTMQLDEKNGRIFVQGFYDLIIADMHTLQLVRKINNIYAFNDKYVIADDGYADDSYSDINLVAINLATFEKRAVAATGRFLRILIDGHYIITNSYLTSSNATVYDLRDMSKSLQLKNINYYHDSAFKVFEDMNKFMIVNDKIETFVSPAGVKRILALGEHTPSAVSGFIASGLYDPNLMHLIVSYIPTIAIVH